MSTTFFATFIQFLAISNSKKKKKEIINQVASLLANFTLLQKLFITKYNGHDKVVLDVICLDQ